MLVRDDQSDAATTVSMQAVVARRDSTTGLRKLATYNLDCDHWRAAYQFSVHSDAQILYHLFERFRHPHVPSIVVVPSVPVEPFLEHRHLEWNRKRPDLVPFSLETDEKRWQYRCHVSLADHIQCQLEIGQPGASMRLLGLLLPKLLAHTSDNTSKPSFDISHVAQLIEADRVLNMYIVLCNCHDELVGKQLL
jgi:hypothetical protein